MKKNVLFTPSALALAIASANSWGSTCLPGQFDVAGGSNCIDASPGFFVDSSGATEETPAAEGHFVAMFGATADQQCELGTFAAVTGMSECDEAPPGRFVDTIGAENAKVCGAGSFTAESRQTICTRAEAGSFVADEESTRSELCPAGRYSNLPAQSFCLEAPEGSFVDEPGLTLSSFCPLGTFTETSGQSVCTEAPLGRFVPAEGATEATSCAVGTYTDTPKSTVCSQALPGFFVGIIGGSEADQCPAGQYSDFAGASECLDAPDGSFVGEAGASETELCDVGTFTSLPGQSICTAAPEGKFVAIVGATTSSFCELGKFTDTLGRSACSLAPAGSFVDTIGASEAQMCTPGSFASVPGSHGCSEAIAGSYVPSFGGTESQACPVGRYSEFNRASVCDPAPAGSFVSSVGRDQFEQCSIGTFADSFGQSACEDAPAGSFVDTIGASEATQCATGNFSATPGSTVCNRAEAGDFVSGQGATESLACPAGKYSEVSGADSCIDAPLGSYVALSGQTTFNLCPIGKFTENPGQSACEDAPAGSFVSLSGASEASLCNLGTYSATAASDACEEALPGSFVGIPGATRSELCSVGTFSNVSQATTCQLAPAGFFVANIGATTALPCPAGTKTEMEGATTCTDFVYGEINLSSDRYSLNEEDSSIDILIERSGGDDGELSVDFSLADGSAIATEDYEFISDTVIFESGETEKAVTITVVDDELYESDETFSIALNNFIGDGGALGSVVSATIMIVSDDSPPEAGIVSFSSTTEMVGEDDVNIAVDVIRELGSTGMVSATYTTVDGTALAGSDYTATTGSVIFTDGELIQSILIPIVDNSIYEPSETLNLALSDIQGGALLDVRNTEITIIDNDPIPTAGVVVFSSSTYWSDENSGEVDIVLNRIDGSLGGLFLNISVSGGSATAAEDYLFNSTLVEFEDGETSKILSITLLDDDIYEGEESILLSLTAESQILGDLSSTTVNIIEDDLVPPAGVIQFSSDEYIIDEDQINYSVTLTRVNGANGEITANINISEGSAVQGDDYTLDQTSIVFNDGDISQTIDLVVIDDMEYEGDESTRLSISSVDGGASIGVPNSTNITIRDNESPPPSGTLSFSGSEVIVNEDVRSIDLTVVRNGGSFGEVSVDFSVVGGSATLSSDFNLSNGTLTFADGETTEIITVDIINDNDTEASEDIIVELDNAVDTVIGTTDSTRIVISENDPVVVDESQQNSSGGGAFNPLLWLFGLLLLPFRFFLSKARIKFSFTNID